MPDPYNPGGNIPSDQQMLLRLIDAKFETSNAKLDGIMGTLTVMSDRFAHYDKRFDDHEHRIATIEAEMAQRKLQVVEFQNMKADVGEIKTWKTEE